MGKKFITILIYGPEAGANFFNHTSMMFSEYKKPGQPIEAVHSYGFYGSPLSGNSFNTQFWQKFKLKVDLFSGNQGELIEEALRSLTQGGGLREFTIEVSDQDWEKGKSLCEEKMRMEKLAREEYCNELKVDVKDWKKYSLQIHQLARQRNDNRIKPFVIKIDWTKDRTFEYKSDSAWEDFFWEVMRQVINIKRSHTCKTYAREILSEVGIPKQILGNMTANDKWPALPRYGGEYKPALFYANGELLKYTSQNTGLSSYYYDRSNGAKLFWMLPPQNVLSFDKKLVEQLTIPAKYFDDIHLNVSILQKIENLIINQGQQYHDSTLIKDIRNASRYFSNVPLNYTAETYSEFINLVRDMLIEIYLAASGKVHKCKYDVHFISGLDKSVLGKILKIVEPALKAERKHLGEFQKNYIDIEDKIKQVSKLIRLEKGSNIHTQTLDRISKTLYGYKLIAKDLSRWEEAKELNKVNVLTDIYWVMTDYMYNPKTDVRSLCQLSDKTQKMICDIMNFPFNKEEYRSQQRYYIA